MFDSIRKRFWNTGKSIVSWTNLQFSGRYDLLSNALSSSTVSWTNQQLSGWYDSLSNSIGSSMKLPRPTGDKILKYVSSAIEASKKHAGGAINLAAITTTAILSSDFSQNMTSWLGGILNKGVPSVYDKSVDAVYNATHIGGGHLHRVFDGSHTLLGMCKDVYCLAPEHLCESIWPTLYLTHC